MKSDKHVLTALGLCIGVAIAGFLPDPRFWMPVAAVLGAAVGASVVARIRYRRQRDAVISHRLDAISEHLTGEFKALRPPKGLPTRPRSTKLTQSSPKSSDSSLHKLTR